MYCTYSSLAQTHQYDISVAYPGHLAVENLYLKRLWAHILCQVDVPSIWLLSCTECYRKWPYWHLAIISCFRRQTDQQKLHRGNMRLLALGHITIVLTMDIPLLHTKPLRWCSISSFDTTIELLAYSTKYSDAGIWHVIYLIYAITIQNLRCVFSPVACFTNLV